MSGGAEVVEKLVKAAVQQLDHFVDSVLSELSKELQDGARLKACCVSSIATLRHICEMTIALLKHVAAQIKLYPGHMLSLQRLAGLINTTFGLIKFVVLTMFVQLTTTAIKIGKTIKQRCEDGVRLTSSTEEEPANDTASDDMSPKITADQLEMAKNAMTKLDAEVTELGNLVTEAARQLSGTSTFSDAKFQEVNSQLKVLATKIEASKESIVQLSNETIDAINQIGQEGKVAANSSSTAPEDMVPLAEEAINKLDVQVVELNRMIEEMSNVQEQTPPATDTERKEAKEQLKAIGKKISTSKDGVDESFAKICNTRAALEEQVRALLDEEIMKKGTAALKAFGIEVETKEVNLAFMEMHANVLESILKTFRGFGKVTKVFRKSARKSPEAVSTP